MFFKVITTIAVTAVVLAAPTPYHRGASTGMAIPLIKHSSSMNSNKSIDIDVLKSHVASHSAKIIRSMNIFERNMGTPHHSAAERDSLRSGAGIHLTNHDHQMWYGTISIGTPAKSFTGEFFFQFDTGSSDLFVPASTGDENCRSHNNLWDPASPQSSANALNQDFLMGFKDGATVEGEEYTDNVTIAGLTADVQIIGAATKYSPNMALSGFAADGLLGLAFPSLSKYHVQSPLFHTLFSEGKLPQPVFSFMLTASGGELYVGGLGMNEALYIADSLIFTPVTRPHFWELNIDNIKVNGRIMWTNVPAIIDTGSLFIFGDTLRVSALHRAYGGKVLQDGYYTFPCSSFPSVTFTIGGKPILIPANVLNMGQIMDGSTDCFSGIIADGNLNSVPFWTIGVIFLQLSYTVFDFGSEPPRVGFASLVNPGPVISIL